MTYKRFEQLPVWQAAVKLGQQIYALTAKPAFRRQRSLRDQIERAAVSVSNNIAEGFERGTTQELLPSSTSRGARRAKSDRCFACWREWISSFALSLPISNLKFQI